MQLESDHLRKRLRRKRQRRTPSNSGSSSDDDKDGSYRPRSRTPPSEFFSCNDDDSPHECRNKSLSCKGLGNDTMSRALNQISKSPFTCRIEGGKLPQQFTQPTFTMYNGWTDSIEHVSHFNQKMVVHSKNEILMCKVFPSSLGSVVMRGLMAWEEVLLIPLRNSCRHLDLVLLLVVEFLSLWTLCCPWPCKKGRPWKRTLIGTRRCSMRLVGILIR